MNAEERRFLAACHALAGMLANEDPEDMSRTVETAIWVADELIRQLAETPVEE